LSIESKELNRAWRFYISTIGIFNHKE
jgi:hypothetical protein